MKKISIVFFVTFLGLTVNHCFAQEVKEKSEVAIQQEFKSKRVKIELERLPNPILISLRDSYAKHFVVQAHKTSTSGDIYFIELRKNRTVFTVAVDNKGRVLREIRDNNLLDQNAVANKN